MCCACLVVVAVSLGSWCCAYLGLALCGVVVWWVVWYVVLVFCEAGPRCVSAWGGTAYVWSGVGLTWKWALCCACLVVVPVLWHGVGLPCFRFYVKWGMCCACLVVVALS